ncbi:hypothetical protein VZT92_015880 [Zoarces viviparus]|uniref:Uncharacterized protein n=1 Tax=Zoarces viviparus TaxID=48416 RepID=A0AAW1EVG4_ZOAVI
MSDGEMRLWLSPALAFGIGIHRQRHTVRHLAPLQSLQERRTEMRDLAALRRGSVGRVHDNNLPPSPLFPPPRPSLGVTSARAVSKYSKCTM